MYRGGSYTLRPLQEGDDACVSATIAAHIASRVRCAPGQRLLSGLLDADVEEAERVQPLSPVGGEAVVKAVRPPAVRPEAQRHRLTEAVQLQAARRNLRVADAERVSADVAA